MNGEAQDQRMTRHMNVIIRSTGLGLDVTSQCTALLGQKWDFRGVSDSGFSWCTVPTYYCRSEYSYSQCPQVQMSIRTECSFNREEHRVIFKLRVFPINQKSEFRDFGVMSEVTRGWVDNEKNSQSWYSNISNYRVRDLYMESESIAIRNGKYQNTDQNTARWWVQEG